MYRTRTCGDLRLADEGLVITLAGWVQKTRKMGGMTFVDIRDRYGITQLVFNQEVDAALCEKANKLGREYVIQVTGTVRERSSKNPNIPTGEIEIIVSELNVLNAAVTPPFTIEDDTDGGDDLRMKYRYLDLRRNAVRKRGKPRGKHTRIIVFHAALIGVRTFCKRAFDRSGIHIRRVHERKIFLVFVRNAQYFFEQGFQLRLYRPVKFFKRIKRRVAVPYADFARLQTENFFQIRIVAVEKHIFDRFRRIHVAGNGRNFVRFHSRFVAAADIRLARLFVARAVSFHRPRHARLAHKRKTVSAPPHHIERVIQKLFGRVFVNFQLNFRVVNA